MKIEENEKTVYFEKSKLVLNIRMNQMKYLFHKIQEQVV